MAMGSRQHASDAKHITPISPDPEIGGMACPLTSRELDVAQLMARGLTDAEISRALCVSVHTARWHAKSIRGKLGLHNRVQITAWWYGPGMMTEMRAFGLPTAALAVC